MFPNKDIEEEKMDVLNLTGKLDLFCLYRYILPILQTILLHPGSTKDNALVSLSPLRPIQFHGAAAVPPFL